jgi:hypothetical protein
LLRIRKVTYLQIPSTSLTDREGGCEGLKYTSSVQESTSEVQTALITRGN